MTFSCDVFHKNKQLGPIGGYFRYCYFHPYYGKITILTNSSQVGSNHQLAKLLFVCVNRFQICQFL